MTTQDFLSRVKERAGLSEHEDARRCAEAVLTAVAQGLSHAVLEAVRSELPEPLAALWVEPEHRRTVSLRSVLTAVSGREAVADGFALEHTTVVAEAMARALRPEVLRLLRDALPWEIAVLFTPREEPAAVERVVMDPSRRTLAEGRPGGSRPLYAARADNAQSESVARADNPHAETKLSSARGLTQEREDETLATGKPGSTRPVSTSRR